MRTLLVYIIFIFFSVVTTAQDMVIAGVIDGPLPGGRPKAIAVAVINDIPDLSDCGLGNANNGGGTDGQEYTFPAVAASAGDIIYIATEIPDFTAFMGFAPTYTSSVANINGDDAIELFCGGAVIDVFGEISYSTPPAIQWSYGDGWALRKSGIPPNNGIFDISSWTLSGPDALDGQTTNTGSGASGWGVTSFQYSSGSAAIPTLGEWGLVLLSLAFLIIGTVSIRPRHVSVTERS